MGTTTLKMIKFGKWEGEAAGKEVSYKKVRRKEGLNI